MTTSEASQPLSLVTYCGGYCGACWIHNGKIREMAQTLQDTLRGWGIPERARALASAEPVAGHYAEFEAVLDWVQAQACPGCRAGPRPIRPGCACKAHRSHRRPQRLSARA